jgi:hypothetical protein
MLAFSFRLFSCVLWTLSPPGMPVKKLRPKRAMKAAHANGNPQQSSARLTPYLRGVVYGLHLAGALPTGIRNPTSEVVSLIWFFHSSSGVPMAASG